jgi:muramoyltetrapeptide carboxypeptidase
MNATPVKLIATGGAVDAELLDIGLEQLKNHHVSALYDRTALLTQDYIFAGSKNHRFKELLDSLSQPHWVWCVRGGYGTAELLPDLQPMGPIKTRGFIGMSDCTLLLNVLALRTSAWSIYGPMVATRDFQFLSPRSWDWIEQLMRTQPCDVSGLEFEMMGANHLQGTVVGGNMSILTTGLGTPFDTDCSGHILFLEDLNEPEYRLLRMSTHLVQAGKLKNLRGLVLGTFNQRSGGSDPTETQVSTDRMLNTLTQSLKIPVIRRFPCGHTADCISIPLNRPVEFTSAGTFRVTAAR